MTITRVQLDALEKAADKVFGKLGLDIEFTRHFLDRANDSRNGKPITVRELAELFVKEYQRWGNTIAKMPHSSQAVMKDLSSELNIPFVLEPDGAETDLVAKTVMRKKDFKTSNKELPVESLDEDIRDNFVSKKSLPEIMRLKTDKQLFADWKKYVLDAGIGSMVMSKKLKQIQQAIANEMKERRLLDRSKTYQFEEAYNPNLYYVQPDGSWQKGGDGRSKGRKRNEIPKGAKIVETFNAQEYFKDYSDAKLLSVVSSGLGKEREHAKKEWERRKASGEKWRREDMTESTGQYYVIAKSPFWKSVHYIDDSYTGALLYVRSKKRASTFDREEAERVAKAMEGSDNDWVTKVIPVGGEATFETSYEQGMDDNGPVIVQGVKGMKSRPFRKKFRNMAAFERWADSDAAGDFEIHQVMGENSIPNIKTKITTEEKHGAKKGSQVKGKEPTPKTSKPSRSGEQKHPMRGRLVGEGLTEDQQFLLQKGAWEVEQIRNQVNEGKFIKDPREMILQKALDYLDKMVQSRGSKQDVGGYAFDIARSFNLNGIATSKELERMYHEIHGTSPHGGQRDLT